MHKCLFHRFLPHRARRQGHDDEDYKTYGQSYHLGVDHVPELASKGFHIEELSAQAESACLLLVEEKHPDEGYEKTGQYAGLGCRFGARLQ